MTIRIARGLETVPIAKAKCALNLIDCGSLAEHADILVKCSSRAPVYEIRVYKDEGFLNVEADGYNVH